MCKQIKGLKPTDTRQNVNMTQCFHVQGNWTIVVAKKQQLSTKFCTLTLCGPTLYKVLIKSCLPVNAQQVQRVQVGRAFPATTVINARARKRVNLGLPSQPANAQVSWCTTSFCVCSNWFQSASPHLEEIMKWRDVVAFVWCCLLLVVRHLLTDSVLCPSRPQRREGRQDLHRSRGAFRHHLRERHFHLSRLWGRRAGGAGHK